MSQINREDVGRGRLFCMLSSTRSVLLDGGAPYKYSIRLKPGKRFLATFAIYVQSFEYDAGQQGQDTLAEDEEIYENDLMGVIDLHNFSIGIERAFREDDVANVNKLTEKLVQ